MGVVVRVAPSRKGVQLASTWRIWTQGDEFYAAARHAAQIVKISFHRNFNWQIRAGGGVVRLAPPMNLSDNWMHVIEVSFLIDKNVLYPLEKKEPKVALIETPENEKLLVNIMLSSSSRRRVIQPPIEIGGDLLGHARLRSGKTLIMTKRVQALSDVDLGLMAEIQAKLRVNFTSVPNPQEVYVEANWSNFSPKTGNVVAIIPVSYGCLFSGAAA
jgi:hypothetical protein